jgi:ferric-dicitrate binding protein FerR (iron transport regulator)
MSRSHWTPGDENVARLLSQAYNPPPVSAEFAERVQARLLAVASEMARHRTPAPPVRRFRRLAALAGVAALLGFLALSLRLMPRPPAPSTPGHTALFDRPTVAAPAPAPVRVPALAPGQMLATRAGERRRVSLPDGSRLSLNQNTTVHYDALRRLTLKTGEIFVEVAPLVAAKASSLFTVATPHREIQSSETKFLVRADAEGTGVAVTQGQVRLSDGDRVLSTGQQVAPRASDATPAPRSSYLLDWMRDLVVSATPPLVPPSASAGGALVAVDPQGQAAALTLRKYHIDVHIEDGFARTTIDQTYFNHTPNRLEGTFCFPLPADASLSRLAMYVDGQLMEGGMVERDYGRIVFEQIVTKMKDPALLEWVDGHTFKMRVFPLEARQEKRIILSYMQRLPNLYGRLSYRFPAGHSLGAVREWSFHARVKDGAKIDWHCDSQDLSPTIENSDLLLDSRADHVAMERDLVLDVRDGVGTDAVRFSAAVQDGYRYLMLRYRPDLPGTMKRPRRDWVFLFESSADRDPLLARTQAEAVRTMLENAEPDDTFALLTADTQVRRFTDTPQRVTPENIAAALAFLDRTHLLGALDLEAGLTAAAELLQNSEHPVLVHLGSGRAVLGERRPEILAGRIPAKVCYVGVAVGRQWAADFMRCATERCQGLVTQIHPDEAVSWRAFDLLATLNAPRLLGVRVTDSAGEATFLCPSSTLPQGEELCAIARLPAGSPLPGSVRIGGTLDGQSFERELVVGSPRFGAAYLPRTWARLEIDRLLAEDAQKHKDEIIALSKAMYVMTPYTSLLVLENEAMYAQYKVDRGRKDHWAMYPCPLKIPVVYEPLAPNEKRPSQPIDWSVRFDPITGQPLPKDWALQFDPITGQPINDLDRADVLDLVNNQLGFYPPALALTVKTAATMHTRSRHSIVPPDRFQANAEYQLTTQQARMLRQEAAQQSPRSRQSILEEVEYERARMPDAERIRQRQLKRELYNVRLEPPLTEIWSGRSLNALLRHFIAQWERGVRGLDVPLSEDILKSINVIAEGARGNIGLVKHSADLQWPKTLQGDAFKTARQNLSHRLKQAVKSVRRNHKPDDKLLDDAQADLAKLRETLDASIADLSPAEYIEARRYLQLLGLTIEGLKDPRAVNYFKGTWTPRGKSVAELVQFMRTNKLWFAPARPGDEPVYVVLHAALVKFDAGFIPAPSRRPDSDELPPGPSSDAEDAQRGYKALLTDPVQAKASLCRQDARLAESRKDYDLAWQRLECAVALEAKKSRGLVALRGDYAWLLSLAQKRVLELTAQRQAIPRNLLDRVMAVADRWRDVDPAEWIPCSLAARILALAGERELAWSYLTTPAALHGATAADWLDVARQQHSQDDYDLAERAFAVASGLEPANAAIAWERALNHRRAGRTEAARALFKQIAEGTWEDRYKLLQTRATEELSRGLDR